MILTMVEFPSLLLLFAALALVPAVVIINGHMPPGTVWSKGLAFIALSHLVISLLILTAIPPDRFGAEEFGHPIFIGPFLLAAVPCVVLLPPTLLRSMGTAPALALLLLNSVLWSIPVTGLCFLKKRKRVREKKERHDQVQAAIDKITADGVVEGAKGPYVPHRKWDVGTPVGTPRHGEPDKQTGYYGSG